MLAERRGMGDRGTEPAKPRHSITSSPSFQARLLEAERWRLGIFASCLAVVLVTLLIRRGIGSEIASKNAVFIPVLTIVSASLALLVASYFEVSWRSRRGRPVPWWRTLLGTVFDLAAPFSLLVVLQVDAPIDSPIGPTFSLVAPALFFIPIVILLSVLRMRPAYSLWTGIVAALAHWSLVAWVVARGNVEMKVAPFLTTYGILLILTGIAAAVLSVYVRRYINEAVAEAQTAERALRKLSDIDHELSIAHEIQQSLLPSQSPDLPGFDIAGMARPANHAGGDYYDWQALADGRLVVAIADVTGHGIGPALVMAVCRAYSRATAPTAKDAADFLTKMNTLIVNDVSDGRFITMAIAMASADGSVELLSAGHGPTFCYRAGTGRVERFGGDGLPLGIAPGEQYRAAHMLRLERGDTLVLVTDGFFERPNEARQLFGIERLSAVIALNSAKTARELIGAIDAEVSAFAGAAAQTDDMTIVVLRRT